MASLFENYSLKGLTLKNRTMMSPMCQYQANEDGTLTDWHFVHYGHRAIGGIGLIMIEASAVEARGRISTGDVGIWSDEHIPALKRIVDFCKSYGSKMAIQLAHAGTKAETPEPNVAPSAVTRFTQYKTPTALSTTEIANIVEAFKQAAVRSLQAGFDTVEIHGAHGYLIHQFLSPITNQRTDAYGGSLENRVRFAVEVITAVKSVLPDDMPLLMRVSADEYSAEGYNLLDMVEMVKHFKAAGVDMIDCSSGGNLPIAPPAIFPGYQVRFAETIKREADIPTIAVGILEQTALAEEVLRNGRADIVAIGRGLLRNPFWAKQAALDLKVDLEIPGSYKRAW